MYWGETFLMSFLELYFVRMCQGREGCGVYTKVCMTRMNYDKILPNIDNIDLR